jgi:hypothetical protein
MAELPTVRESTKNSQADQLMATGEKPMAGFYFYQLADLQYIFWLSLSKQ